MGDHFLLVASRDSATRAVAGVLEQVLTSRYSICSDNEEAITTIAADTPSLVLSDFPSLGGCAVELVSSLAAAGPPVAVTLVLGRPVGEPLPLSPLLTLIEAPPGVDELRSLVSSMKTRIEMAEKPYFRMSDYLYLAELARSTEALHLHLGNGKEALLEIVDGEVWNAWYEDRTAEGAVAAVAVESPRAVSVTRLKRAPAERQTGWPTSTVLEVALGDGGGSSRPLPPPAVAVVADPAVADPAVLGTATVEKAAPAQEPEPIETVQGEEFDTVFAAGIEATLARRYDDARQAFERALELRPHDRRVRFNLQRLSQLGG